MKSLFYNALTENQDQPGNQHSLQETKGNNDTGLGTDALRIACENILLLYCERMLKWLLITMRRMCTESFFRVERHTLKRVAGYTVCNKRCDVLFYGWLEYLSRTILNSFIIAPSSI